MQSKPIIKINKFVGSGKGRLIWNDGFSVKEENGQVMMVEDFKQEEIFNDTNTDYIDYTGMEKIVSLKTLDDDFKYELGMKKGRFYNTGSSGSSLFDGYVGGGAEEGSTGQYDLLELPSGNLIYSKAESLGFVARGEVGAGSNTVKIVDVNGHDMVVDYEIAVGDTISNLNTGAVYTITSITTTTSTNDTLNFTAVGALTNSTGDEFLIFNPDRFDLDNGIAPPIFKGQPSQLTWARQIVRFDNYHFILNGNYLALLDNDETTFENNFKQLLAGHQAYSISLNNNYILISTEYKGEGHLLLWDGYSDGWNNDIKIEGTAKALTAYNDGWVFMVNGVVYKTNGYSTSELTEFNDISDVPSLTNEVEPDSFNQMTVVNNIIYIANNNQNYNRSLNGVYYFNPKYGWGYMPPLYNGKQYRNGINTYSVFYSANNDRVEVATHNGLTFFSPEGESTDSDVTKSFIMMIPVPTNQQIKGVGLNIGIDYDKLLDVGTDKQAKITVALGDGKRGVFGYNSTPIMTTTTIDVAGQTRPGLLGSEVLFLDGDLVGERTFIQSIADPGTSGETWTVSPELSGSSTTPASVQTASVYSCGSQTIAIDDINEEKFFYTTKGVITNKIFVEVTITGITNAFPVSIMNINLYA